MRFFMLSSLLILCGCETVLLPIRAAKSIDFVNENFSGLPTTEAKYERGEAVAPLCSWTSKSSQSSSTGTVECQISNRTIRLADNWSLEANGKKLKGVFTLGQLIDSRVKYVLSDIAPTAANEVEIKLLRGDAVVWSRKSVIPRPHLFRNIQFHDGELTFTYEQSPDLSIVPSCLLSFHTDLQRESHLSATRSDRLDLYRSGTLTVSMKDFLAQFPRKFGLLSREAPSKVEVKAQCVEDYFTERDNIIFYSLYVEGKEGKIRAAGKGRPVMAEIQARCGFFSSTCDYR